MNKELLQAFVTNISSMISIESLIGVIAVALFYGNRFNSWTAKEAKYGKALPPRQFTTWARFVTYATLYTLTIEALYLLLLASPNLVQFLNEYIAGQNPPGAPIGNGGRNLPLWVMVFLLGFFPQLPVLREVEEKYRHWLHQRAFIPAEAKALVNHLIANPGFFKPDEETANKVIQNYGEGMPPDWGRQSDNRLSSKWFRLVYLREKMEYWRTQPEIERFMNYCEEEYKLFKEQFDQLQLEAETYIRRYPDEQNGADRKPSKGPMEHLKINITRQIEKMLGRVCEFIACGVLSTERIHSRRIAGLNFFGLYPTYEPGIPIILDIVLKNAVIAFLITTLTSTIYLWYDHVSTGSTIPVASGLVYAVIALLAIGLCIFAAVLLYRLIIRKSRFRSEGNSGSFEFGPFVHQCIAFSTGYICGLIVIFPYKAIALKHIDWGIFLDSLQWPLVPAITSGFVVYYLAALSPRRRPIKDAILQGLITGIVGLIACLWAFDDPSEEIASFVYIVTTSMGIGGVIGYFFPSAYQQRVASIYHGAERRRSPRISISARSALRTAEEAIECEAVSLSTSGAQLNAVFNAKIGDTVKLHLPGVGSIDSQIVRKGEHVTAVEFLPEEERVRDLLHYIGEMALVAS